MSYLHSLSSCRTWTAQWRYWRSFSSCRAMRRRAWGCACAGDFGPWHLDDLHHVEAFVAGTKSITWINKHRKHSYFLHILKQIFKAESLWFLEYPVWNSGNKLLSFNLLLNYCINSWGKGTVFKAPDPKTSLYCNARTKPQRSGNFQTNSQRKMQSRFKIQELKAPRANRRWTNPATRRD